MKIFHPQFAKHFLNPFMRRAKEWAQKGRHHYNNTLDGEGRLLVKYVLPVMATFPVHVRLLHSTNKDGDSVIHTFFSVLGSLLWPVGTPSILAYVWLERKRKQELREWNRQRALREQEIKPNPAPVSHGERSTAPCNTGSVTTNPPCEADCRPNAPQEIEPSLAPVSHCERSTAPCNTGSVTPKPLCEVECRPYAPRVLYGKSYFRTPCEGGVWAGRC
jgi:hypothetical protein